MLLAVIAAEALHGRAKINLDADFKVDKQARTCEVELGNEVGRDIARIMTGLLTAEIGETAYQVETRTRAVSL